MIKKGNEYEEFVSRVYNAIIASESISNSKIIQLELKKNIKDKSGIKREFDIYWEYELGGLLYKTIIECKDYNKKIPIEKIDALVGKLEDFPDFKAVFATKVGYQSGAERKAKTHNIELLIVREQNDSDWIDEDGSHYLKSLMIELKTRNAASIIDFKPIVDLEWLKDNTQYDKTSIPPIEGLNTEVFIINNKKGEKYSLFDLQHILSKDETNEFTENYEFEDCFIQTSKFKFKIKSYQVKYKTFKSMVTPIEIDLSKELIGVVEYINKKEKKRVFNSHR